MNRGKKPFKEKLIEENIYIRTFSSKINENELVWHFDKEDRIIIPIEENDWQFQMDNDYPQKINKEIFIPKGEYHRLIKGTTELKLKLIKKI